MVSDAVIREHLERVVPLQENFNENLDRLNECKREARSDGLSMEALNAFLPILVRNPHDKGARVLNEMIRYAEALGVELSVSSPAAEARTGDTATGEAPDFRPEPRDPLLPVAAQPNPAAQARLRLVTQVVVAASLSFGLLWLLN